VNAGTCTWTKEYAIIWFSGENFSTIREQFFNSLVLPGQTVDLSLDMIAPQGPGIHQSNWKLRNPQGILFGLGPTGDAPFWVRIEVEEIATRSPTPPPLPSITPTLAAAARGAVELVVGANVDLDTGKLESGNAADLGMQKSDNGIVGLTPLNGAKLALFGGKLPTDLDCRSANLTFNPMVLAELKEGDTVCYRTNQGLPGYFRLKLISIQNGKTSLDYITWSIP
jgi:hypothetical protein